MTELINPEDRRFEEGVAEVDRWVNVYASEGSVDLLDPELLRSVLTEVGANFEKLDDEGRKSLSQYSNKRKHVGMKQVWGTRSEEFRGWTEQWVRDYEQETGKVLPNIVFKDKETGERRPSKTEGMRQFLGEITAYAAGCMEIHDLILRLEVRHSNFTGEKKRIAILGYNISQRTGKEKPFAPASFPPEFPPDAWDKIKSWRQ